MQEYVTDAIVLEKEPLRDFDTRYFFFTKRFGKLAGKATSARKITSKLAGHLEPGSVAKVRFVHRSGGSGNGNGAPQIADALKYGKLAASSANLHFLNKLLPGEEMDAALWNELAGAAFSWPRILRILGWDPGEAACEGCGRGKAASAFYIPKQEFFCAACALKLDPDELILLGNAEV